MTIFMFANNVDTTLAGAISSSATSLTLSSIAHLPTSIPAGQVLVITLNDQATRQNFEVIYATAVSGATLSGLARGQEGTSALAWSTGDFAYSAPTAGQQRSFGQLGSSNTWSGANTFTSPVVVGAATAPGDAIQLAQATGRLIGAPQLFPTAGTFTYTPTPGMTFAIMKVQGAGAAGAGASVPSVGNVSLGAPGTCGAYGEGLFTAAAIGASQTVTIGAGGAAGPNAAGGNGGASSVGSLISAPGGIGGSLLNNQVPPQYNGNGSATSAPTGANIFSCVGTCQGYSASFSAALSLGGAGGSSVLGSGPPIAITNSNGTNATNPGCGGSGVGAGSGSAILSGGTGFKGFVEIWEYF